MLTGSVEPCLRSKFRYGFFCNKDLCDNFADCRRNLSGNSFVLSSQIYFYNFVCTRKSRDGAESVDWSFGRPSPQLRNQIDQRAHSVASSYPAGNESQRTTSSRCVTSQASRKISTDEVFEKLRYTTNVSALLSYKIICQY